MITGSMMSNFSDSIDKLAYDYLNIARERMGIEAIIEMKRNRLCDLEKMEQKAYNTLKQAIKELEASRL